MFRWCFGGLSATLTDTFFSLSRFSSSSLPSAAAVAAAAAAAAVDGSQQGGHCPHDEVPDLVATAIAEWWPQVLKKKKQQEGAAGKLQ